jgi:hypothetical protein
MECLVIREFFDKTNNNKLIKPGIIYNCTKQRYNLLLKNGVVAKVEKDVDESNATKKKVS